MPSPPIVETTGNIVTISGQFNRDIMQRACAAMHNLRSQGRSSINLDLRQLQKAYAADLLPFAMFCRGLLVAGLDTVLELPEEGQLNRLFLNSNWAHLIDPQQFDASEYSSVKHMPATTFTDAQNHFEAVDRIVDKLLSSLEGFTREQLASLEWAVNEITDNVLNHAASPCGGVVQLTAKTALDIVEFVVCDAGVGIPRSLREAHPNISSDVMALDRAIREGVTRSRVTNMGNGLFGSFRIAEVSGGYFSIYSGYAMLTYKDKKLHVGQQKIPYAGTVVVCGVGTSKPDTLSEALSFKGEKHFPANTFVDRLVDAGEIRIKVRDETRSFGSRDVARPIRIKIENLLAASGGSITIDLDEVALISSSFADEVFGKLFAQLGPIRFMSRIQILGTSRVVQQLIDRAITQRLSLGDSSS